MLGAPAIRACRWEKDDELLLVPAVIARPSSRDVMTLTGPAGICRAHRLMSFVSVRPVTENATLD